MVGIGDPSDGSSAAQASLGPLIDRDLNANAVHCLLDFQRAPAPSYLPSRAAFISARIWSTPCVASSSFAVAAATVPCTAASCSLALSSSAWRPAAALRA